MSFSIFAKYEISQFGEISPNLAVAKIIIFRKIFRENRPNISTFAEIPQLNLFSRKFQQLPRAFALVFRIFSRMLL
jgi:hypothetical protein